MLFKSEVAALKHYQSLRRGVENHCDFGHIQNNRNFRPRPVRLYCNFRPFQNRWAFRPTATCYHNFHLDPLLLVTTSSNAAWEMREMPRYHGATYAACSHC